MAKAVLTDIIGVGVDDELISAARSAAEAAGDKRRVELCDIALGRVVVPPQQCAHHRRYPGDDCCSGEPHAYCCSSESYRHMARLDVLRRRGRAS